MVLMILKVGKEIKFKKDWLCVLCTSPELALTGQQAGVTARTHPLPTCVLFSGALSFELP